ncbi:PHP domain-containing protein [Candidatus Nanosalina sp. VS9-1]|uniref:PHP domain-containing protein n=1 Tax=Candidatus Nanosalina sp. VS9-1 TaxID=3388566 RepID=UPI0039E0DED8
MVDGDSIKVDLHIHSDASHDCNEPVDLILEHAQEIDIDAIAITDHDSIENSLEAAEKASEYGLIGIPGVEVSTADGHLLALGVEECPEKGKDFMETVEEVREMGGIAVVPHPFQVTRHGVKKSRLEDCDALEVYNSWAFTGWKNRKARSFAKENNYPEVASSDAHSLGMIGKAYTEINTAFVDEDFTAEDVLQAIETGSNYMYGKRKPVALSVWDYGQAMVMKAGWLMKETLFLPLSIEKKIFRR